MPGGSARRWLWALVVIAVAQSPKLNLDTMPKTLAAAHDALGEIRPASNAPLSTWRAFRQLGARVYAEVADIDRFHHHEALYWAGIERDQAEQTGRQMRLATKKRAIEAQQGETGDES
jgi:hypothetical protein